MKIAVFIIAVAVLIGFGYLAFSFVQFSWSASNWHWITRALFAVYAIAVMITVTNNINGQIK